MLTDKLLPILQAIQGQFRYLPEAALRRVCEISDITPAAIVGVASFYSQFRMQPMGEHLIRVCHGTACHVKGAERVTEALCRHLAIEEGRDTSADGRFTIQKVACLGCCTLAPVVQVDDVTFGHMVPDGIPGMIDAFFERLARTRAEGAAAADGRKRSRAEIRIGTGSCCVAGGAREVRAALSDAIRQANIHARVTTVGCVGMCHNTPLVEIVGADGATTLYSKVRPEDVMGILLRHFRPGTLRCRAEVQIGAWLGTLLSGGADRETRDVKLDTESRAVAGFIGPQRRIATELCGQLDPLNLEQYRQSGGFEALERVRGGMSAEAVIAVVRASGLRGRGGAGFPTGEKWARVRASAGARTFVVMNGDEGDPGAFMDRMILESYPFRVLEGVAIAAHAVGATEAVLYIRAEYPLAVERMREAIRLASAAGWVGGGADGPGVPVRIVEGAGAFVCGEETALLESVMGRRGMPRLRPPYPAEQGLWNCPTLVNNVETFALVPWILRNGAEAFRTLGVGRSQGTKVFALAGKVARGGLIEVPMGLSLRQIVEEIGGGVADGRVFKAVQIGGPSGGCIPASLSDTVVDYEALIEAGAMMGSGGLVVLDDRDCMVDVARYFLSFTQQESCGKCTFCRIGTRRMLEILERLCAGEGRPRDLELLETLARQVKAGSLCGLGQTAPNPVLTTLKYFRDEYEAHMKGTCPAMRCRALIRFEIGDACIGCTKCAQACPADAIRPEPYRRHTIDQEKCIQCGGCRDVCPVDAVAVMARGKPEKEGACRG